MRNTGCQMSEDQRMNTLDLFKDEKEFKSFKTGEIIFREGEPGATMYVVMDDAVDICESSSNAAG